MGFQKRLHLVFSINNNVYLIMPNNIKNCNNCWQKAMLLLILMIYKFQAYRA